VLQVLQQHFKHRGRCGSQQDRCRPPNAVLMQRRGQQRVGGSMHGGGSIQPKKQRDEVALRALAQTHVRTTQRIRQQVQRG
jgi:hypothetical protein